MFHSALLIFLIFVKNINARFYPEFVKIQSNKESIVDYYLELIEFETEEAKDYVLPTSNVEHFLGYNPGNDKIGK